VINNIRTNFFEDKQPSKNKVNKLSLLSKNVINDKVLLAKTLGDTEGKFQREMKDHLNQNILVN